MYATAYVWAKVLRHVEERLDAVTVSAYFDDAEVVELNEEQLILYSPNDFRREFTIPACTNPILWYNIIGILSAVLSAIKFYLHKERTPPL